MRFSASFSAVLEVAFGNVGGCTPLTHILAEGFAVVAPVGIELFRSSLGSDSKFIHGTLGTNNVVAATLECHIGQWRTVLFGEQANIGAVAVVGVITSPSKSRCLHQGTV